MALCKELEKYRLFFLEDPLPPEEKDHFRIIRNQSSVPLAMGELFNQVPLEIRASEGIDFAVEVGLHTQGFRAQHASLPIPTTIVS